MRLIDDNHEACQIAWHVNNMVHADKILDYMITNKLTGNKIVQMWKIECSFSLVQLMAEMIKRIENERKARPVLFGKDYIS